jgi:hypothetical protein
MNTKRDILDRVAKGDVDPREAARLLAELEDGPEPAAEPAGAADGPRRGAAGAVRRVRVVSELGRVTVVGDPTVATVAATGHHEVREDGDAVEVRCAPEPAQRLGFVMLPSRGSGRRSQGLDVTIRMNPALALDLSVAAGKVAVRDVVGPIHAEVELGSLVIDGFAAPIDLSAAAGSIVARGRLDHGDSAVRCELGKVRLELAAGSSVAITARTELGSVTLPGGVKLAGLRALPDEPVASATVGAGSGTLDVRAAAGRIEVVDER